MNRIMNRDYLNYLPTLRKISYINMIIDNSVRDIEEAAANGRTMFTINPYNINNQNDPYLRKLNITNDDFITTCKLRFPDCAVSFIMNCGFIIDWS